MEETRGLVVFGTVVGARPDGSATTDWLRELVAALNEAYRDSLIAEFAFSQDELQGLLSSNADPLPAILRAGLTPPKRRMRWVVIRGPVDPGQGPAIERTGEAFLLARRTMEAARAGRERLVFHLGDPDSDGLANDMASALVDMIDGLTDTQREVARLALIDRLRQADVAARLGKRRATVSVSFARAKVVPLERLTAALRRVLVASEPVGVE